MGITKIKASVILTTVTLLNFMLLAFSKRILGDSLDRVFIKDVILTSFYFLMAATLSIFILLFFSDQIFKLWLKKFMVWFAPLAVLLIAIGSTEVNYGWPTRTSFAIFTGEVMVVVTLLFALVQRFYYGVK